MEQLIIIKSVMKPKNYSTLRALLQEERGEKITPYIFKLTNAKIIGDYLEQEQINYEIYEKKEDKLRSIRIKKEQLRQQLIADYQEAAQDKELNQELVS
jgi:hypothetical protein